MTIEKRVLKIIRETIKHQKDCGIIDFNTFERIIDAVNEKIMVAPLEVFQMVGDWKFYVIKNDGTTVSTNTIDLTVPNLMSFLIPIVKEGETK